MLVVDESVSRYNENTFPFPLEHLLSQNPIMIPADNVINTTLTGSWSAETLEGGSEDIQWKTSYHYTVNNFTLNATLDRNREMPVKDTDTKALLLNGTGTYSYDVTVTTVFQGTQVVPAAFETATVNATRTTTVNLRSSGDVKIFAGSSKIDESKDVIAHENEIENMKTNDIHMYFENPETTFSGTVENHAITVWEDGKEKEESWSTPVEGKGAMSGDHTLSILFKYPVD